MTTKVDTLIKFHGGPPLVRSPLVRIPLIRFLVLQVQNQYQQNFQNWLCSKIRTSGNWLCSTNQYEFRIVRFFPGPKNRTKWGPPVLDILWVKLKRYLIFFPWSKQEWFCTNSCYVIYAILIPSNINSRQVVLIFSCFHASLLNCHEFWTKTSPYLNVGPTYTVHV